MRSAGTSRGRQRHLCVRASTGPVCGKLDASLKNVTLKSNEVTISFTSGLHRSGRGFLLSYATDRCPGRAGRPASVTFTDLQRKRRDGCVCVCVWCECSCVFGPSSPPSSILITCCHHHFAANLKQTAHFTAHTAQLFLTPSAIITRAVEILFLACVRLSDSFPARELICSVRHPP